MTIRPGALPAEALRARLTPVLETPDETMRRARGGVSRCQYAVEDAVNEVTRTIRRHPLCALTITAGAGAFAGCAIGFALGRLIRGRE